jgi:hypothetical protein
MATPTAGEPAVTPPGRSWQMIRPGSDQMTSSLTANASGKGGSLAVRRPRPERPGSGARRGSKPVGPHHAQSGQASRPANGKAEFWIR